MKNFDCPTHIELLEHFSFAGHPSASKLGSSFWLRLLQNDETFRDWSRIALKQLQRKLPSADAQSIDSISSSPIDQQLLDEGVMELWAKLLTSHYAELFLYVQLPQQNQSLAAVLRETARLQEIQSRFDHSLQRDKLQSLYQLAYGLSHEINNPLANISSRAQMLLADENDQQRRQWLATIIDQSQRAHEMIGDLMLFARPPAIETEPIQAHPIIERIVASFAAAAQLQNTSLLWHPSPAPAPVLAAEVPLYESLATIVRNSLEALASGGTISIATSFAHGRCKIQIRDTGPGLSAVALKHAFDPYYCGREAGRGLGMGLARAWRFIHAMQGTIRLESPGLKTVGSERAEPVGCFCEIELLFDDNRRSGQLPIRTATDP